MNKRPDSFHGGKPSALIHAERRARKGKDKDRYTQDRDISTGRFRHDSPLPTITRTRLIRD